MNKKRNVLGVARKEYSYQDKKGVGLPNRGNTMNREARRQESFDLTGEGGDIFLKKKVSVDQKSQ